MIFFDDLYRKQPDKLGAHRAMRAYATYVLTFLSCQRAKKLYVATW